jgi:hypothetical protein
MTKVEVTFISEHRKATSPTNPDYPNGVDLDMTDRVAIRMACLVDLPYPAECCGKWLLNCQTCGYRAVISAAGRRDDPRSVKLPCRSY